MGKEIWRSRGRDWEGLIPNSKCILFVAVRCGVLGRVHVGGGLSPGCAVKFRRSRPKGEAGSSGTNSVDETESFDKAGLSGRRELMRNGDAENGLDGAQARGDTIGVS